MNPKKAIKILETLSYGQYMGEVKDARAAERLGIEALKRLQELRTPSSGNPHLLLPGETEDSSQEAQEINPESTIN